VAQHPKDGRDHLELLADLAANLLQSRSVVRADLLLFGQVVEDLLARDPVRERFAPPLASRVGGDGDLGLVFIRQGRVDELLGLVEEPALLRHHPLTRPPEALVAKQANGLEQPLDLGGLFLDLDFARVELVRLRFELVHPRVELRISLVEFLNLAKGESAKRLDVVRKLDRHIPHAYGCSASVFAYKTES
jgi:hypothetical protein